MPWGYLLCGLFLTLLLLCCDSQEVHLCRLHFPDALSYPDLASDGVWPMRPNSRNHGDEKSDDFLLAPWSPTLDRKLLHLWFQLPPGRPVHSSSAYRETGFGLLCYHRLTLPFWAEETRLPAVINIWAASPSSSCSVSNFSPSVPHLLY